LRDFRLSPVLGGFGFTVLLSFNGVADLTGDIVDGREMEVGDIRRVDLFEDRKVIPLNRECRCDYLRERDGRCRFFFA